MKKNRQQISLARKLRREQTSAERALWARLKNSQLYGVKFRRQQLIGPYVVDFVSFDNKLVLEVDGGQHNWQNASERDGDRTIWLQRSGYQVLRFWNNEVLLNIEGTLERIREALK